MLIWFLFFLFGWSSFTSGLEDVYLWKGKYSLKDQKISIPQYLIIRSYARSIPSPLFQKVDSFLIPPYLEGGECSVNRDIYSLQKIKGVLPPNTPFKAIRGFYVLQNPGLIKKLIHKVLDFRGVGIKGGPATYYLVRDSKNKEFILNETIAYEPNFYRYKSLPAKRAANILSHLTEQNQETKKVLLTFELTKEHNEKCGWGWPKGKEPKRIKPKEEIKILKERILQFMQKNNSPYIFENIQSRFDQMELDLNRKALAFLILNSSPLRIKNISLVNGHSDTLK